jgi:hypothetical protein
VLSYVDSQPAKHHKKANTLTFYFRIREELKVKSIQLNYVLTDYNPSGVLTKVIPLLKPYLSLQLVLKLFMIVRGVC